MKLVLAGLLAAFLLGYLILLLEISKSIVRARSGPLTLLYWVLPVLAAIAGLAAANLIGAPGLVDETVLEQAPAAVLVMLMLYAAQALAYGYIFKCAHCGTVRNTFRMWWRGRVYFCPGCGRPYVKGRHVAK